MSSSTDGQFKQRRFRLEESITTTDGARTTFIEHMTPGTQVPPHYHNRFAETFDLISGSMTVYRNPQPLTETPDLEALEQSAQQLEIGRPAQAEPTVYHRYVVGDQDTTLRCTLTPGDADFERLLMILDGLAEDGKLDEISNSPLLLAVMLGLSDAHPIGPVADLLGAVEKGKSEDIKNLKEELLGKYDNEERLKALLDRQN